MFFNENVLLLKKIPHNDKNTLYVFLGEQQGKFTSIAYHIEKSVKRGGHYLDYLNLLNIEFKHSSKKLPEIQNISLIEHWSKLRSNYDGISLALSWLQWINQITAEHQNINGLFASVLQALQSVENNSISLRKLDLRYRYTILQKIGYPLQIERCLQCHHLLKESDGACQLIAESGGFHCYTCSAQKEGMRFSKNLFTHLHEVDYPEQDYITWKKIIDLHLQHHLGLKQS